MLGGRYSLAGESSPNSGIFLGRDDILDRPVALQRVAPAGVGSEHRDEAERTVGRAAGLRHPQVVRVLDIVSDDSAGAYWLVTEPAEGITLSELVSGRGRLIVNEAAALTQQAADALAAAHEAGIVHGDVRPANILVDRLGRVKLTGFGIVRPPFDAAKDLTGDAAPYLSPEVLAGWPADEAGDVWSLGATVLHALSGRPPVDLEHDRKGALVSTGNLPALFGAGSLTPLLEQSLSTNASQRWSMAQVRDHLAASSRVVTQQMPVLLSRVAGWNGDDVTAGPEDEPRRFGALTDPGRGVLVGLVAALVVAIATGATMLGRAIDAESSPASLESSRDTTSPSPETSLIPPLAASTIRPKSPASGGSSGRPAGSLTEVAVSAPHRSPRVSPSSSPSSSTVAYRPGSSSSHGPRHGSPGSHPAPPPPQGNPRPDPVPLPPVITPPIDPPPIDPPPIDPPPIDPPPIDPPPVDPAGLF